MKRIVLLVTVALVALMIFVPSAMAQETTSELLPSTGGQAQPLPVALLLSLGVVATLFCTAGRLSGNQVPSLGQAGS